MEAKELRIGNYVYPFDDINLVDIKTIFKDSVCVSRKDFKDTYYLEPIPLTKEWLLKFGFKYLSSDKEFLRLDYGGIVFNSDDSDLFNIVTLNVCSKLIIIKHVHQLQNLYFALTQQELLLTT